MLLICLFFGKRQRENLGILFNNYEIDNWDIISMSLIFFKLGIKSIELKVLFLFPRGSLLFTLVVYLEENQFFGIYRRSLNIFHSL